MILMKFNNESVKRYSPVSSASQVQFWRSKPAARYLTTAIALLVVTGGVAFAVIQFGPLLTAQDGSQSQPILEAEPLPANLMTVKYVDSIQQTRRYTGIVRARRRSLIGFELAGKINEVNVDEGDMVAQGELIATLDASQWEAQRDSIQARLQQAKAVLDELNAGPRIERIKSAAAEVASAKSDFENAQLRMTRRKSLYQNSAIPIEEYQQAEFDFKTRKAQLEAANQRLAELNAGTRSEKITAQMATVRSLEASLAEIKVSLGKCKLMAPFDAVVSERFLDPGSIAQPSGAVVKLVEESHLEAWIGLPVDIAVKLKVGDVFDLELGSQTVSAVVGAKISEVDPSTRTQTIIFKLPDEAGSTAVSGQLCKVPVTTTANIDGCWIPNSALSKGVRGLWSVMAVVRDESGRLRAEKRDLETIIKTDEGRVLVKGTLRDGDQIVADGVHRITSGQAISDASLKQ